MDKLSPLRLNPRGRSMLSRFATRGSTVAALTVVANGSNREISLRSDSGIELCLAYLLVVKDIPEPRVCTEGKTFSKQIHEYLALTPSFKSEMLPWSQTNAGKKIVTDYLNLMNATHSELLLEIQGMADGASIPFQHLFLMNLRSEVGAILDDGSSKEAESCSDVHVNHAESGTVAIGHNEDSSPLIFDRGYMVNAEITGASPHKFTAYAYPGELPGNAFGFNSYGLAITVNALYPKMVLPNRAPRNFLTRSVLSAKSLDEAVNISATKGLGGAYAFCVNIVYVKEKKLIMLSIENAPDSTKKRSFINVHEVKDSSSYFHVNLYRNLEVDQRPNHITSSKHRTKRIKEFLPPQTIRDVLKILGDTADGEYPLYRTPLPTDNSSTVATALYDFRGCTLSVFRDNPYKGDGPIHVFPLPCDQHV
ncbi:hypothetical protein CAPTEDRAFT_220846 [Capitella teleta]|uniref:Peptidase C45 hydrolase domain-containing protein n=1 Tax=Capitella teleta TaxID=283909 RepID=R7V5F8_CAPTE|nr:hypothetical protein CAPTEDRAFT_220846 [Capitella teleta]|eukprot:ELU14098.1 hypothetical protein CAPTEDRAFT_220846 [Capitella teleta]